MKATEKPKEFPEKPVVPEIIPEKNIPVPPPQPEHPPHIAPTERPEKTSPPEIIPEK